MSLPISDGRIEDGIHPASLDEVRTRFGVDETRQLVLDATAVVIHRLHHVAGEPNVILGGPVLDLQFPGLLPFARVGAYVRDPVALERALVDDQIFSLITTGTVSFAAPVPRSDITAVHAVGGLVQAVLVHRRSLAHLTYWAGRLMDVRGLEIAGGGSTGVVEVQER